ncbi:prephenate dehydrogenase [Herbiconiux flava]|uniref:Prephenate dehydrogenase n=1 Tax=Herbiconiux flava TaxID=881268 RepID=A0A852SQ55_9MICO|nr:prephenate dehydrogenase [Herbiconiux flava]NYD70880.1 prephenate dehydrogenase [Herbiconiux flava]GLK19159.1 prephenate dehydrogenase [Herbiconiux flava]
MTGPESRLTGPVRVVGVGLLGTSIALGLRARGVDVILSDASPTNVRIAMDYGAGRSAGDADEPQLIVVCVPPDVTASVIVRELSAYPRSVVTDVASVKGPVLAAVRAAGADVTRYVGSHPLAGREKGGPMSGRADLFLGRPWVVAGHPDISYQTAAAVDDLVLDLGATLVEMTAEQHDSSVALVSHAPQLVSTLMARRLVAAPEAAVNLAGGGLRDVTRVASSDPGLWVQILGANAGATADVLRGVRDDLDEVLAALDAASADVDAAADGTPWRRALAETLAGGNAGVARIPGKHGQDRRYAQLVVMVDDAPGELARLLTELGEDGVNLEDLRLEHSPGAQIGLAEIAVLPETLDTVTSALAARGWRIAG